MPMTIRPVCGRTPDEVCSGLESTVASTCNVTLVSDKIYAANLSKFSLCCLVRTGIKIVWELPPYVTFVSCPSVSLLGVTLDCRVSFTKHIKSM